MEAPARPSARSVLAAALADVGVPAVDGAVSPKDDAIGLLSLAAEVEHALMVQYLYAAQSVRGSANRTIAHVAIQEMGHLVTVQNLLLALTGVTAEDLPASLHLGRDGLRRASERNPLPLVFEPLSHGALAKFVVVEQPAEIEDPALKARVDALETEVAALGVHPNPVYALYAAIRWIFLPDDGAGPGEPSTGLGFRPGWHLKDGDFVDPAIVDRFAAEPAEWGSMPGLIVSPVRNRDDALAALQAIATQGEGLPGATESHFRDFLRVLDMFEAGQLTVSDLPRSPRTALQPDPEDAQGALITDPYTVLWADLFNASYQLLLVDLAWAISQPRETKRRSALISMCIDAMRSDVIRPLAAYLAKRPLDASGRMAGPPYGLEVEDLPSTPACFTARYALLRGRVTGLTDRLRAAPEFPNDTDGQLRIESLEQIDAQRVPHLPEGS